MRLATASLSWRVRVLGKNCMTPGSAFMAAKGARSDSHQRRRVRRGVLSVGCVSAGIFVNGAIMELHGTTSSQRRKREKSAATSAAGGIGTVGDDGYGDGLALGAELSGAGFGDVSD